MGSNLKKISTKATRTTPARCSQSEARSGSIIRRATRNRGEVRFGGALPGGRVAFGLGLRGRRGGGRSDQGTRIGDRLQPVDRQRIIIGDEAEALLRGGASSDKQRI